MEKKRKQATISNFGMIRYMCQRLERILRVNCNLVKPARWRALHLWRANMKRIETVTKRVIDLKSNFGNPRKISTKNRNELKESLKKFGDFGLILIDENDNVIAGNQRVSVLMEQDPEIEVLCKRLVGYTKSELKAINIKDNTHSGEWDVDMLADWTADLEIDLGLQNASLDPTERTIPEMEPIHYEKYDYVMIVCRSELDYNDLVRKLGIEGQKVRIAKKRKINARAIWYDKMQADIIPKDVPSL